MSSETTRARDSRALNPTHELAYYLWYDILGNEDDPWKDINFKRRFLSNAKRVLKEGADLETLKLALELMRDAGRTPQSPQVAIDWVCPKSGGLSYYQVAQKEMEKRDRQPPTWDAIAYAEWETRRDRKLQGTTTDSNLQSDS